MFEKVLIPTDLSDASDAVAGRIGELPGVREVVIFHIREAGQSAPSDEALRRLEETVKRQGISAAVLVTDAAGEPIPALILKAATDTGADLIAMATRAQGMMRNLFAEKTTMEVLRGARVHVLIVPAGELDTPLYVRLLFPTDLSAPAPEIRSLLDSSAGEAVVLHVADPGRAGADKEAGERLAAMKADLAETGREITALVRLGIPGSVICDAMNELHPSLVVIPRIGKRDAAGSAPLGSVTEAVVGCARAPVLVLAVPIRLRIAARELRRDEFVLAEEIWTDYHQLKGDPEIDRIFGVFAGETLVSVARCRRHPDGYEVDGVFTPVKYRGRGYARQVMDALVEACHHDTLYMHSVRNLVGFYGDYGFEPIPESELPPTIRARFAFALGEMEGANVQPMRRRAGEVASIQRDENRKKKD